MTDRWARKRKNPRARTGQQGKIWMYLEGPRKMAAEGKKHGAKRPERQRR